MNKSPISIVYLPDWYIQAIGRTNVSSVDIYGFKKNLQVEDLVSLHITNEIFCYYLYGVLNVRLSMANDLEESNINYPLNSNFMFIQEASNVFTPFFGTGFEVDKSMKKEQQVELLCRAFEDVNIFIDKNNNIIVYHDKGSNNYYNRKNLLKKLCGLVYESAGYKRMVSSRLFRQMLPAAREPDFATEFLHRVG